MHCGAMRSIPGAARSTGGGIYSDLALWLSRSRGRTREVRAREMQRRRSKVGARKLKVEEWWALGVGSWKLDVGQLRLKVDRWRSTGGGGRLEVDSGRWIVAVEIWKLEVDRATLKIDWGRLKAGGATSD
eukprot:529220-Pyramimonas_sp.AAC.1